MRYASLDAIGHYYLRYAMPSEFGDVTDDERRRLGLVLESHYSFIDAAIGRAIAALGPDDLLLIVSGYGMEPLGFGKRLLEVMIGDPGLSGTHEGAPDGFLMAYGPSVARSRLLRAGVGCGFRADAVVFPGLADRTRHGRFRPHGPLSARVHGRAADYVHPDLRQIDESAGRARTLYCFALFNAALRGREEVKMSVVLDADQVARSLARIAHEILERNRSIDEVALVGIRTRGVPLAKRIAKSIQDVSGHEVPTGALDITLYRDDLMRTPLGPQPVVRKTEIQFSIDDKRILLVDDVLYTGRTIRAALDALIDFGRPRAIQLIVLVDRGHRELPIKADYVGKNLPTSAAQSVQVHLAEIDGRDEVEILP